MSVVDSMRLFFSGEGRVFSGFGERDARPCVTRVRFGISERCPASTLRCVVPGPLGDASGSLSLVMTSVNVDYADVSSCL